MAKASKASRQAAGDESKSSSGNGQGAQKKDDASALLKEDHRKVERLFKEFEDSKEPKRKKELASEICRELIVHSRLEEEIFYPACREKGVEDESLDEAQVEHDTLKFLIGDVLSREPGSPFYDAKIAVLSELVKHHVAEEEKSDSGIFARARAAGVDMAALGSRLRQSKQRLMAESGEIEPPEMRSLRAQPGAFNRNREENDMERWNERDERGGYMGGDDDRGFSRDRYSSAEGDDDNGGRYTRRGGNSSRDMERDRGWRGGQGQGGNRSDYRQSGGTRSSRGSGYTGQGGYEDDSRFGGAGGGGSGGYDRARSGGYGGQGEYRGSRQGGYSGSRGYRDSGEFGSGGYGGGSDDFGRSSSRSGGGMGGTEDEFSRGSRRDYDRGGSRGGFERERDEYARFTREDDEDRGGRGGSRGVGRERDEQGRFMSDDDNGGRGGRGSSERSQGGWFGDSRGHAEAARRGWRDRD